MVPALSNKFDDNAVAYPWRRVSNILIKGYVYRENKIIKNEDIVGLFINVNDDSSFLKVLQKVNGYFSVIIELEEMVLAATDLVCSTPIMYAVGDDITLGDDYRFFINKASTINKESVGQYLASGYVYGQRTLLDNVKQLVAGTYLNFCKKRKKVEIRSYYEYIPQHNLQSPKTKARYVDELHELHLKVFGRMVESLGNRLVVLPLSGGYDSRLILEMLKKYDYKNILCVTWGDGTDWQAKIAKSVAEKLGVNWMLVEHRPDDWRSWYRDTGFDEQLRFCGVLSAIPYLQENILIKDLCTKGIISKDSIFLSGNSGDFIEGGHIPENIGIDSSRNEILAVIRSKHMRLNTRYDYSDTDRSLKEEFDAFQQDHTLDLRCFLEFWEWKERQSKFVTNCVKPFESNGYEWRMPFWDKELMEFWKEVPVDLKKGRRLFYSYSEKYMDINLAMANPNISILKLYRERNADSRYGCYMNTDSFLKKIITKDVDIFNSKIKKYIVSKNIFRHKINALIAIDIFSRLERTVAAARLDAPVVE